MVVNKSPLFASVKRVLSILYKDRNVKSQFKSCKTSEVFWVDRVVTIFWVMLYIFNISV